MIFTTLSKGLQGTLKNMNQFPFEVTCKVIRLERRNVSESTRIVSKQFILQTDYTCRQFLDGRRVCSNRAIPGG